MRFAVLPWLLLAAALVGCGPPPPTQRFLPETLVIDVTGHDFEWHIRYPGPDGKPGTRDDVRGKRDIHVPVGVSTLLRLHSRDYIYILRLPHKRLKEAAVPDLEFALRFRETTAGIYPLRGDQMCGFDHPNLIGRLIVEPEAAWWAALEGMGAE